MAYKVLVADDEAEIRHNIPSLPENLLIKSIFSTGIYNLSFPLYKTSI